MKLDLNLFRVFEAIYREGSVSAAARSLHLSQPAVSHSLAKLRTHFDDPLFERDGSHMRPTAVAQRAINDVQSALRQLQLSVLTSKQFSPSESNQHFRLSLHPSIETFYLSSLQKRLSAEAPHIRLSNSSINRKQLHQNLSAGFIDVAVDVMQSVPTQIKHRPLTKGTMAVVVSRTHPTIKDSLSQSQYLESQHIVVSSRGSGTSFEDFELGKLGLERSVKLRCQQHATACAIVAQSDLIATLPAIVARRYESLLDVKVFETPYPTPVSDIHMYWHERLDNDPATRWLRNTLVSLSESLAP
jgi:DNA-binding transcriptional LysR family regulator